MGKEAATVTSKKMDFSISLKFMYLLHDKFNKRSPLHEGKQSLPSKNTSNLSNSLEMIKKKKKQVILSSKNIMEFSLTLISRWQEEEFLQPFYLRTIISDRLPPGSERVPTAINIKVPINFRHTFPIKKQLRE